MKQRIRTFFSESDARLLAGGALRAQTDVGLFYPSGVQHIEQMFALARHEGLLQPDGWFLDAGAGDARSLIVAAGLYNIPAAGIEYDETIIKNARQNIERFSGKLHAPVRLVQGDFTEPQTYKALGIPFDSISMFFNYFNNHDALATMIASGSQPGATFLFLSLTPRPHDFPGLKHKASFSVTEPSRTETKLRISPAGAVSFEDDVERLSLHIYQK